MGSKSSSSQASANYDQRVVVQDGIGLSASSGNHISVQTVDAEIVGKALDSVNISNALALDSVNISNALAGDNYTQLLNVTRDMFNTSEGLIGQTQQAVADAYSMAQNDAKGTIDNRTMIILGVAAAAVVVMINRKG